MAVRPGGEIPVCAFPCVSSEAIAIAVRVIESMLKVAFRLPSPVCAQRCPTLILPRPGRTRGGVPAAGQTPCFSRRDRAKPGILSPAFLRKRRRAALISRLLLPGHLGHAPSCFPEDALYRRPQAASPTMLWLCYAMSGTEACHAPARSYDTGCRGSVLP